METARRIAGEQLLIIPVCPRGYFTTRA